ncbi:MAG: hypothetical protein R2867_29615 [Caldilineaceae bacterium]
MGWDGDWPVPVGFKYFVDGLLDGSYGFGGEESAGASFLRKDGTVWTTNKDGIILGLLARRSPPKLAVTRVNIIKIWRKNSAARSMNGSARRPTTHRRRR